jgi:hypothetical protein|tara:strand:- start:103 stop:447 length:345 start_codon:yes stop_codon:yes gene_type:complete
MKSIVFILMSLSFSATAQIDKLEGIWTSPGSSYYTTIMYNVEQNEFKIINFSFAEDNVIPEVVTEVGDDFVSTSLYNKSNDYSVNITYEVLNEDQILCVFEGDLNKKSALTRFR